MNRRAWAYWVLKWALLVLAVLLIAAWVASASWTWTWFLDRKAVFVVRGRVEFLWISRGAGPGPIEWVKVHPQTFQWWPGWESGSARTGPWELVALPLWVVWGAILIGARKVWMLELAERKRVVGEACAGCGYSREGLEEDAKCPECGKGGEM